MFEPSTLFFQYILIMFYITHSSFIINIFFNSYLFIDFNLFQSLCLIITNPLLVFYTRTDPLIQPIILVIFTDYIYSDIIIKEMTSIISNYSDTFFAYTKMDKFSLGKMYLSPLLDINS